jgi:hypothetical protein
MEPERDHVHQRISHRTELKIARLFSTSRKGRSMVLHPIAKERGRCNRFLAKNVYWSSPSKAQSDVQQRLKMFSLFCKNDPTEVNLSATGATPKNRQKTVK